MEQRGKRKNKKKVEKKDERSGLDKKPWRKKKRKMEEAAQKVSGARGQVVAQESLRGGWKPRQIYPPPSLRKKNNNPESVQKSIKKKRGKKQERDLPLPLWRLFSALTLNCIKF